MRLFSLAGQRCLWGAARLLALGAAAAGCAGDVGRTGAMQTVVDTVGDTIVARTSGELAESDLRTLEPVWEAGRGDDPATSFANITSVAVGPDERLLVWDQRTPVMRLYAADGALERTVGRIGSGPGEFQQRNVNGIAAHASGRWLVWDASNSRINVYAADGSYETMWRLTMRMFGTQNALTSDTEGTTWMMLWLDAPDRPPFSEALARFSPSGAIIDTVFIPEPPGRDSGLVARAPEGSQVRYALPYGRNSVSGVTERGGMLWALNTPYVVHAQHGTRVLRIEREWAPIAIPEGERAMVRRSTEASLKNFLPSYTWNGPDIPTELPPIRSLYSGTDGRVWVEISAPFERYTEAPGPRESTAAPRDAFRPQEKLWDVFAEDGVYLGRVRAPRTVRLFAARGAYVWGSVRDADDVPTLVKFRVTPPW